MAATPSGAGPHKLANNPSDASLSLSNEANVNLKAHGLQG